MPPASGYAGSALTALLAGLDGGAGLGLVLGRPGIGKTAVLVHLGLETLLADGPSPAGVSRQVLHVALRDSVDHARAHCDEVLRAVIERNRIPDAALRVERGRMIHSFAGRPFDPAALNRNLTMLAEVAQFTPSVVLVDGLPVADAPAVLPVLAKLAQSRGITLWAALRLEEGREGELERLLEPAQVAIRLVAGPQGQAVRLMVVKGGPPAPAPVSAGSGATLPASSTPTLALDPTSLLVVDQDVVRTEIGDEKPAARVPARECTLYSGGAAGAEAAFGAAAERWGAHEVNFTFEGHIQARTRGRYELSPKELAVGDVSLAYVSKRLNRNYNDKGGLIRGVLQTLWHMVSRSQQVFVVGLIQEDGTVVGGTGWSVELARMWSRDLWVFDQARTGWFRWDGVGWTSGVPNVTAMHLCGTGTRYLSPAGKTAIDELFARSFGG
ncbi:MAG: hypothetical protein R3F59_28310 [Myxococcota bacterium]